MDRNALAELLQALESRRDAEERRREERYTALIERFLTALCPVRNWQFHCSFPRIEHLNPLRSYVGPGLTMEDMHGRCAAYLGPEHAKEALASCNSWISLFASLAHQHTQQLRCWLRGSTTARSPQRISMTTVWNERSRVHLWGLQVGTFRPLFRRLAHDTSRGLDNDSGIPASTPSVPHSAQPSLLTRTLALLSFYCA
ncbi:UNVERIFIED_CONTAM: hypothetical protein FKN15_025704 [Acipenser sinensis]